MWRKNRIIKKRSLKRSKNTMKKVYVFTEVEDKRAKELLSGNLWKIAIIRGNIDGKSSI
jgi:hypothetical protein